MDLFVEPSIVGADRLSGSLVVSFSDGRAGLFSSTLLYDMLESAEELFQSEDSDSDE